MCLPYLLPVDFGALVRLSPEKESRPLSGFRAKQTRTIIYGEYFGIRR